MAKRVTRDEMRCNVSFGLLNIGRPDLLEDCELADLLGIRGDGSFWGKGRALREKLLDAAGVVSEGLADIETMAEKRALLDHVLAGKSLSQFAREHGKNRENLTRRHWRALTEWVTDALEAQMMIVTPRREA